jgi:uncharacterized protein YoxC
MSADKAVDWTVRRYKDELAVYRAVARHAIAIAITLLAICISLGVRYYITQENYSEAQKQIRSLTTKLETTQNSLETMTDDYNTLVEESEEYLANYKSVVSELEAQNKKVVKANKKLRTRLNELEAREELFDKYEYALYDKMGNRTDLTYDQVTTGEELMLEKGMDPDLLFGIIMTESGGDETASNSTSSARGYGQLLSSTGKMVYEQIQGHGSGTYNHSMAYTGSVNISMTVSLLAYFRKQGYSLMTTIRRYRGINDVSSYIATINSYIKKNGNSISKMASSW